MEVNTTHNIFVLLLTDWPGWMLLCLSYLLLFCFRGIRDNRSLLAALVFVLTLHHAVAIVNAYITTTMGASVDANTFHHTAVRIANDQAKWRFASGPFFYQIVLAIFYKLFGSSLLLGEELSILAFELSCFVFVRIYKTLGYSKNIALLILLFGSLPTMVLIGSVTLRESWQILFLMLTIYFSLRNLFFDNFLSWFGILVSSFVLALFHEGFAIFVFLLASFIIFYQSYHLINRHSAIGLQTRILSVLFTAIVTAVAFICLKLNCDKTPELEAFHALSQGNALSFIADYHARAMVFAPRTAYGFLYQFHSVSSFLLNFLTGFICYMFSPFPWQISNVMDIYAFLESMFRFLLILFAIMTWFNCKKNRKKIGFILLMYFLISALWSLGTVSYGTSLRHHIVTYWMLILLLGGWFHAFPINHRVSKLEPKMV